MTDLSPVDIKGFDIGFVVEGALHTPHSEEALEVPVEQRVWLIGDGGVEHNSESARCAVSGTNKVRGIADDDENVMVFMDFYRHGDEFGCDGIYGTRGGWCCLHVATRP